jgi:hypothetical protein
VICIGAGRKGKYEYWLTDDGLLLLEGWARRGLTDEQIAKNCRVKAATLYNWKKKYFEIFEALKKGKDIVDIEVENALYKRAVGYEYEESKLEDGVRTETKKHMPPDVTAGIFWLKNRMPELWRDRTKADKSTNLDAAEQQARLDKLVTETKILLERHELEKAAMGAGQQDERKDDGFIDALKGLEVWDDTDAQEADEPGDV